MGAMQQILLGMSSAAAPGQQAYTSAGTYTWVAPSGVTKVSVIAVGVGGAAYVGSGGGLGWTNNIVVSPGNSYVVQVGTTGTATVGTGDSFFCCRAIVKGGEGHPSTWDSGPGGSFIGNGGGTGGATGASCGGGPGGGGAGGYTGNGGAGGSGTDGSGGGGGGVGILGAGANGGGGGNGGSGSGGGGGGGSGTGPSGTNPTIAGSGGSGGTSGSNSTGGLYGGGHGWGSSSGGRGAVRIIWPGCARSFPSTRTADE